MVGKLEDLILEINEKKCLISSLTQIGLQTQLEPEFWRASIRVDGEFSTGSGHGATAYDALSDAWAKLTWGDAWSKNRKPRVKPRAKKRIRIDQE